MKIDFHRSFNKYYYIVQNEICTEVTNAIPKSVINQRLRKNTVPRRGMLNNSENKKTE